MCGRVRISPMYQIIQAIAADPFDKHSTHISFELDEKDILLKKEIDNIVSKKHDSLRLSSQPLIS